MKKEMRNKIIVCAAAVLLAGAMLLPYFLVVAPKNVHKKFDPNAEKTVTLQIKYSGRDFMYENLNATGINTVLELLEEYDIELNLGFKYETSEFGAYITEFKNTPQDKTKGYFYTYTLNGDWANAISAQKIEDGDVIIFSYLSEVWEEIDGVWVQTSSTLQPAFEPKTVLYIILGIAAALLILAAVYISLFIIKSKKKSDKVNTSNEENKPGRLYSSSKQIVYTAVMAALLIVGKFALAIVPNIEVVTTLVIVFAYCAGWPALAATLVFCAADCILYPPAVDVMISYFIYWNLLALIVILLKKCGIKSEIPYIITGFIMTLFFGVLTSAISSAFYGWNFWVVYSAGIVFYVLQLMSTLVFMSIAFKRVVRLMLPLVNRFSAWQSKH